jgi:hypothetical protein
MKWGFFPEDGIFYRHGHEKLKPYRDFDRQVKFKNKNFLIFQFHSKVVTFKFVTLLVSTT